MCYYEFAVGIFECNDTEHKIMRWHDDRMIHLIPLSTVLDKRTTLGGKNETNRHSPERPFGSVLKDSASL